MAGKSFEGYLNHLRYWLINYISLHISAILFQGVISSRTPTQTNEVRAMYHRTFLFYYRTSGINCQNHCMKNFQIRSFFWSVFSCIGLNTEIQVVNLLIQSEYRKIETRKKSVFGQFSRSEYKRQSPGKFPSANTLIIQKPGIKSQLCFHFFGKSVIFFVARCFALKAPAHF